MDSEPIDIIDPTDGRVLYFSCDRFIADIGEGDCCFICGAKPGSKEFDEEHVFPDWIVRRFRLGSDFLDLPLDRSVSLRRYVVNCCQECNGRMSQVFETPLSTLTNGYTTPNSRIPDLVVHFTGFFGPRSYHVGGANVLMGAGTVHFLSNSMDLATHRALHSRNGREPVGVS